MAQPTGSEHTIYQLKTDPRSGLCVYEYAEGAVLFRVAVAGLAHDVIVPVEEALALAGQIAVRYLEPIQPAKSVTN